MLAFKLALGIFLFIVISLSRISDITKIRKAMLEAKALGVKITGAGLGGCLIGLVRDSIEGERVIEAALQAGAVNGWNTKVDAGAKVDHIR